MKKTSIRCLKVDKATWVKNCSYTGIFLHFLTLSLQFYWGNMSVYIDSFFKEHVEPGVKITSSWILACFATGSAIGSVFGGYIALLVGTKWTMVIGCVVVDCGTFLSTLSVQHSVISLYLSMGLATGVGCGLTLNSGLQHLVSFQPKNVGLVIAAISSGQHVGGACLNQLITWYINPANLNPDLYQGRQKYFTQPKILNKVPSLFLVLGLVFVCCQAIGIFLIRLKVVEDVNEEGGNNSYHEQYVCQAEGNDDKARDIGNKPTSITKLTEPRMDREEAYLVTNTSPRQTLKSVKFYVLCFMKICIEYSDVVFVSFFKTYGQIWIRDDQFLAYLSTSVLLVSIAMRPVWGSLVDVCGVKFFAMALSCMLCTVSNFWYFTPMVNRWLYFFWTIMFDCINAGINLNLPILTLKFFGSNHFSKNYGMVAFSSAILSPITPPVIQKLFSSYGWFYLFFSVGCTNAVGLILILICLPWI